MPVTKSLKAKVCLVGDAAVGKTSLIRRAVLDQFDDAYVTTLGTKVTKKVMDIELPDDGLAAHLEMMVWDIMGQPGFRQLLKDAYFYNAHGILAVADLTRRPSLEAILDWVRTVEQVTGKVPTVIAINKADLEDRAAVGPAEIERIAKTLGTPYIRTSAKTGANVEEAFLALARRVAAHRLKVNGSAAVAEPVG